MDNIRDKEKFIGESKLLGNPETKFTFKLKKHSVTGDKLAPDAVGWDKLSQRLKDLLVAIQAAIGEAVDPDTIKEMIRNIIREMIDSGDEIIDEDALADRITQAVLNSLGEKYPSFKLDESEISTIDDVIDEKAPSDTQGEVVFSTTLHTFLFKVTDEDSPNYGKYYKDWEGSDDYLTNNNADPKKGVIFMVEDGSDYYYWDGHNLVPLGSKDDGGDVEVKVDEYGITLNEDSEIALRDIPYISGGNKIGTTYVWDNKIPSEKITDHTKYLTALDITRPRDGVSLPAGSKIVPNGGIPIVPITGGEMSWVHSSDIGMIQDDGSHSQAVGAENYRIFKNLVENTRYNLILDGDYYLYASTNGVEFNVQLNRSLYIKDGKLFLKSNFLTLNVGSYFHAENTVFERLISDTYPCMYLHTEEGMIEGVEFINCKFSSNFLGKNSYTVLFLDTSTIDIPPSDVVAYKRWKVDLLRSMGHSAVMLNGEGDTVYAFKSNYTIHVELDEEGNEIWTVRDRSDNVIEEKDWDSIAQEKHPNKGKALFENENGEWTFVKSPNGKEISNGKTGYFKLISKLNINERNPAKGIDLTDGKSYDYQIDTDIRHVDEMGIKVFRLIDCHCDETSFSIGNITCRDICEVRNCFFTNLTNCACSLGTANSSVYSNEWLYKSCCSIFDNCTFSGPNKVIKKSKRVYTCGILAEGNASHVTNCRFVNLISNYFTTYECYLSVGELVFEGNYIFNVFSVPQNTLKNVAIEDESRKKEIYEPLYEWMKSKGAPKIGDREPVRIYRNNWFEIDYGMAWDICKDYMEEQYADTSYDPHELFDTYAMRQTMFNYVSTAVFRCIIVEGNTFMFKGGNLRGGSFSGKTNRIRNLFIKNNTFNFKSYPTRYENPLIAMRVDTYNMEELGIANLEVTGNTFVSGTPQSIELITIAAAIPIESVKVQNNTFENCNYRITSHDGSGRGVVSGNTAYVDNNVYNWPVGIPSVVSHQTSDDDANQTFIYDRTSPYSYIKYKGDLLRIVGKNYSKVEVYDRQNYGEEASTPRLVSVPNNGYITVKTPYMNRSLYLGADGYPDFVGASTSSLIFTYSISRWVSNTWVVEISYTINGERKHRHMEIANTSSSAYPSIVVRDVNGGLSGDYPSNKDVLFDNLSSIDDVGLKFFIEASGFLGATSGVFALFVYTGAEGTKNDRNTDIEISVRSSSEKGIFTGNKDPDYTNFTPIHEFVPSGSEVTQQWLNTVAGNFSWMGSRNPRTGPYMRPTDVGLRVHVGPDWYTWKGTWNSNNNSWNEGAGWEADKKIVVLTQAEYEALAVKDQNTLYVIQDAQS